MTTDFRAFRRGLIAVFVAGSVLASGTDPADAQESYQRITGEGSSWAATAIDTMRTNVAQFGISVDYAATGSSTGRKSFLNGTVDFAASDIPFQFAPEDGSAPENPAPDSYVYIPVTAGGTAFVYNLVINGKQVTNLRLSGENVAKIFTGAITAWNDPAIAADNPGLSLPGRAIVPVVRSDGSGSTAQFTKWMIDRHPGIWNDYCGRVGRSGECGYTSFYPTIAGMIAQAGDVQVAGYVQQGFAEGAIGYVNYSYALGIEFPVAKVLNAAGYYTEPTPENVAVSLLQAKINNDASDPAVYLTQDLTGVYSDADPRNYQLSSYSYFILPTVVSGNFNVAKGRTLGAFAYYAMCEAQQTSASLGYSPIPINLVEASFEQIRKIPGVEVENINAQQCNNPTFSPDGANLLAENAPQPKVCDKQGQYQCPDGTAGARNTPTDILPAAVVPAAGGQQTGQTGQTGQTAQTGQTGQTAGATDTGQTAAETAGQASGSQTANGSTSNTASGSTRTSTGSTANGSTDAAAQTGTDATAQTAAGLDTTGSPVLVDGVLVDSVTGGACDPDTGLCESASGADVASQSIAGQTAAATSPVLTTALPQRGRWATQALTALVVLFTLALVFVPGLAWRHFARRDVSMEGVA